MLKEIRAIKKLRRLKAHHHIIFAIIIGFAIISFWRGIWGLLDIYLFPSNLVLSLWASTILGALILIITRYLIKGLT